MSYPIGANTWIWVAPVTDDHLARLGPRQDALALDGLAFLRQTFGR